MSNIQYAEAVVVLSPDPQKLLIDVGRVVATDEEGCRTVEIYLHTSIEAQENPVICRETRPGEFATLPEYVWRTRVGPGWLVYLQSVLRSMHLWFCKHKLVPSPRSCNCE